MINTVYAIKQQNTQTWDKAGKRIAVTVARLPKMTVTQVKTDEVDGYTSVQVGFEDQKPQRINKPTKGHLQKAKIDVNKNGLKYFKEIRVESTDDYELGKSITQLESLSVGDIVKASTHSKGTGFTGVMKRWGFAGGPRTHGQSDRERAPGSIGQGTDPGRVWKGKKMAGHDGNLKVTQKNLMVIKVDTEAGVIWLSGTTPGYQGSLMSIIKTGTKEFAGLAGETTETEQQSEEEKTKE